MTRFNRGQFRLILPGLLALLLWSADLSGQQVTVRGRVVGAQSDQPIPGASVSVPGTRNNALTDARGQFTINVPSLTLTLVVTSIGYSESAVPLNGRSELTIRLSEQAIAMEQVVVVGYGTQRKSDITGSVATVDAKRFENSTARALDQAIQGAVPGVTITTTSAGAEPRNDLVIRGRNSIKAGNRPLIVLDGIPYEGSISEINQSDIESINILKDASAAAIYGARGSNGLLLVTTKRGSGGPRITYDGYSGIQELTNLPALMNGAEFAAFKCQRLRGGTNCDAALTATELANLRSGQTADWVNLATRTGFQQQHNLSFAGSAGGTRYYVQGSVLDVGGVARNDEFQRYSVRLNLDQEVKSWVRIGTNTQLSLVDRGGLSADFEDAFFMNPLTNPYQEDGRTLSVTPWPEDIFWGNPLQGLIVQDDDLTRRVFSSNYLELSAPFLPGLSYRFNGGLDFASGESGRYYGRDTRTGLASRGRATTEDATRADWTAENVVRFRRAWRTDHDFDLTTLFSVQGNDLDVNRLTSEGFPNDVLTYYQANVGALVTPSYNVTRSRIVSQMARLNYAYRSRYLLTLTARRDGYSGFGTNHKYGTFPSIALGWNLGNERPFPALKMINSLKLRASYGQNGNQAIQPYQTLARLDDYSYIENEATAPGFIPVSLGNPNLRWETTSTANLGIDFGLWSNRVQGSVDVYDARTRDLLLDRLISPVHGVTRIAENIGKTRNSGVELQLTTLNLERGRLSWSTDFNIAANRNEIVDLYGSGEDDLLNGWFIGRPIDVNYAYKFAGIWQTADNIRASAQPNAKPGDVRITDLNGDGKIDPADRTFIGSLEPDYTAGLTNTVSYGGLTLSAFLTTVQGITRANGLLGSNLVQAEVRRNTIRREYWTPENPINTAPANREDANLQSVSFFEDASFMRLKDLTLSYNLPGSLTAKLGGNSMRIYLSGRNLWTQTNWTGLDPELSNQRAIPLERVIVGGLNVQF